MQWSLAAVTPANQKMCFDSVIPLPWIFSQTITVERTATCMKAFAEALFICNDEKKKKKKISSLHAQHLGTVGLVC